MEQVILENGFCCDLCDGGGGILLCVSGMGDMDRQYSKGGVWQPPSCISKGFNASAASSTVRM